MQGLDRVAVSFMGDGATDIGSFHEALNLAALWDVPVIFVVENNGYADFIAQSAHQRIDRISDRAAAYGMPGQTVDGNDVLAVREAAGKAVARARDGGGPSLLECVTYRWRGHYEGDPQPYRNDDEVTAWKARDPLLRAKAALLESGALDEEAEQTIRQEVQALIASAVRFAEAAPAPEPADALADVYTDAVEEDWAWLS